jgi:WD40 repeat protein
MSTSRLARVVLLLIFGSLAVTVRAEPPAKVDARGDPLPASAIARLGTIRFRHGDGASFVAFLPGGKEMLTVGRDETVRFWDVGTGKELRHFRLRDENAAGTVGQTASGLPRPAAGFAAVASSVALSSDGKILAYSTNVPPVRLFDVAAGKELRSIPTTRGGAGVLFAPDGKTLAVQDLSGPIRLYEVATAKELRQLAPASQDGNRPAVLTRSSMTFSPDCKMLVTGSTVRRPAEQAPLVFWDTATGKEIRRIPAGGGQVGGGAGAGFGGGPGFGGGFGGAGGGQLGFRAPAFSPDRKALAWIDGRGTVALADPSTGKEIRRLVQADEGRRAGVLTAAAGSLFFAPDSKTLAFLDGYGSSISVWDVETGKKSWSLVARSVVRPVSVRTSLTGRAAFSPDSKLLALGGDGSAVRFFEVATGKEINATGHLTPVTQLSYARDGKTVLAADEDRNVVAWDVASGKELRRSASASNGRTTAFTLSSDGRHFATNGPGAIALHDAIAGKEVRKEALGNVFADALALSADNKQLAVSAQQDDSVLILVYDLATGKEVHRLMPPTPTADPDGPTVPTYLRVPSALQFSPDGQFLVAPFEGDKLVFWRLASGREAVRIEAPLRSSIFAFAFSGDSRSLVVDLGADGPNLYETTTGKERRRFGNRPTPAPPTDDDLVRQQQQARLRALASASRLRALGISYAVAISPDSRIVAQGQRGGAIQLWDVATGKELGQFQGHRADVTALAFAGEGKTLASGSGDTTILIWDVASLTASAKLQAGELNADARWNDLSADDASKAFDAICAFAAARGRAVPFLKERLRPAAIGTEKIQSLIADLDNEQFAVRRRASNELEQIGESAAPALRKTLEDGPSAEVRRRATELLDKIGGTAPRGELLRSLRAIEALERIGTPEAKAVLQSLAKGTNGAMATKAAQAALDRLER